MGYHAEILWTILTNFKIKFITVSIRKVRLFWDKRRKNQIRLVQLLSTSKLIIHFLSKNCRQCHELQNFVIDFRTKALDSINQF